MCSWAWQGGPGGLKYSGRGGAYGLDTSIEAPGELSWVFTLVIVSLISAVIGAIVMIIVLHCKRIKTAGTSDSERSTVPNTNLPLSGIRRPPMDLPPADNKPITRPNSYVHHHLHHHRHQPQHHLQRTSYGLGQPHSFDINSGGIHGQVDHSHLHHHHHHSGVWQWLTKRCSSGGVGGVGGNHLMDGRGISPTATENHYTHMDETYNVPNGTGIPPSNTSTVSPTSTALRNPHHHHHGSASPNAAGEALYAELDSTTGCDTPTNPATTATATMDTPLGPSAAYQNSAYTDPDLAASCTPPSSAYYSDLSVTGGVALNATAPTIGTSGGERAYEVVGCTSWAENDSKGRLSSISEAVGNNPVPSDYV